MSGQQHPEPGHPEQDHPDATALAEYQAGLVGGPRGRRLAAHVARCAECASVSGQLGAVSSALASVPAPSLPEAVERRITTALATEAALAGSTGTTERAGTAESTGTTGRSGTTERTGTAGHTGRSHRVRLRIGPRGPGRPPGRARSERGSRRRRPAVLAGSAAAVCLVLFGLVYFVGLRGSPAGPASSSAARGSVSSPRTGVAAPAAGSAQAPHIGLEPAAGARGAFVVTASGTRYQAATLAAQVRARLSAHSSGTGPASAPPPTLAACVLHLTGNVRPELVDRATYQGRAAYVIAVSSRVWVVGPGCTAGDPRLITTVSLAG